MLCSLRAPHRAAHNTAPAAGGSGGVGASSSCTRRRLSRCLMRHAQQCHVLQTLVHAQIMLSTHARVHAHTHTHTHATSNEMHTTDNPQQMKSEPVLHEREALPVLVLSLHVRASLSTCTCPCTHIRQIHMHEQDAARGTRKFATLAHSLTLLRSSARAWMRTVNVEA